jgi:excisionase family DNA binding protein
MEKLILTQLSQEELKKLIKESVREVLDEDKKNDPHTTPYLLNIEQAAAFLQISVQTIYGYTSKRMIPFIKRGKKVLFVRADLEKWFMEGKKKSVAEMKQEIDETGTLKF